MATTTKKAVSTVKVQNNNKVMQKMNEEEAVENVEKIEGVEDTGNNIEKVQTIDMKKKYADTDGILCKSITPGGLYMPGIKSKILYRWEDIGDETEVEAQDLISAIRSHSGYVFEPYFVIEDEEFVSQYPEVEKVYENMYSVKELTDVFSLSPSAMKQTILSLPKGAQNSIKHLASQMISNGSLDSVKKIKYLDEIFGTEMTLMTGLFRED